MSRFYGPGVNLGSVSEFPIFRTSRSKLGPSMFSPKYNLARLEFCSFTPFNGMEALFCQELLNVNAPDKDTKPSAVIFEVMGRLRNVECFLTVSGQAGGKHDGKQTNIASCWIESLGWDDLQWQKMMEALVDITSPCMSKSNHPNSNETLLRRVDDQFNLRIEWVLQDRLSGVRDSLYGSLVGTQLYLSGQSCTKITGIHVLGSTQAARLNGRHRLRESGDSIIYIAAC